MESFRETFGHTVRRLRMERGYSQIDFAYEAKISANYLGHIERGEYNLTLDMIERLAVAFELRISELMVLVEKAQKKSAR